MKLIINIILSICAISYTVYFMSLNDLTTNNGALSKTGISHPVLFFVWGILVYTALCTNIFSLADKFNKITNFHIILVASFIGMLMTLIFKFDYSLKMQYLLHCSGSLIFSVCTGIEVFITYMYGFKKNTFNAVLTVIIALILITDLILLIIFKQNALIEGLPIIFALAVMPVTQAVFTLSSKSKETANAS
jgi:hypothetical protein